MREKYKEIYKNINPDNELLNSVIMSVNQKNKINAFKYFSVSACVIAAFCVVGVGVYVNYKSEISVINEIINVPLAYETKKQTHGEKHIVRELQNGKKKLYIDADVIVEGDIDKMCIYNAEYTDFSPEEFEEMLCNDERFYSGVKEYEKFIYPKDTGFYLQSKNKLFNETVKFEKSKNSGCKITVNEATEIVKLFVKTARLDEFKLVKTDIVEPEMLGSGICTDGYYSFQYYQYADGFPLETVSADVYSGIASSLNFRVDDDGIVRLMISGLDLTVKQNAKGKIMSVEKAIEITENSLPELWLSEYAPVVEIRLEYMLHELEDKTLILIPCWHFCIDETQLKKMSVKIQRENDTNDLCIDAVTGEMFRVADRYPVYLMSDGSIISTWKN